MGGRHTGFYRRFLLWIPRLLRRQFVRLVVGPCVDFIQHQLGWKRRLGRARQQRSLRRWRMAPYTSTHSSFHRRNSLLNMPCRHIHKRRRGLRLHCVSLWIVQHGHWCYIRCNMPELWLFLRYILLAHSSRKDCLRLLRPGPVRQPRGPKVLPVRGGQLPAHHPIQLGARAILHQQNHQPRLLRRHI